MGIITTFITLPTCLIHLFEDSTILSRSAFSLLRTFLGFAYRT